MMKRILYNLLMALMVVPFANTLVSCSTDDVKMSSSSAKMQNGFYVYENIDFNCQASGYDEGTTRAVTYNWQQGATLFARFKSGLSYYLGFITRTDTGWTLISTNDFLSLTTSGTCELFYFQEAYGDYYYVNVNTGYLEIYNNGSYVRSTDIRWNSETISLSEETAVYASTANYSTTTKSFKIEAVLEPKMWRLRFSGSNATSITLPGSDNDIQYCSAFNWSASSTSFSMAAKDVSLKVSNGYTPYVYGEFVNANSSNKITVKNANGTYTRNLNASSLPVGTSGYFDIPTESNYSSKGWSVRDGSLEHPFNVADVIQYVLSLGADVQSPNEVYIKGFITSITEVFGTQYGNATFRISDTKEGLNEFLCFRVKYFGGKGYSDPTALNIKEGDEVIICGKVVNYKGSTPETVANVAYVYSINGIGGGYPAYFYEIGYESWWSTSHLLLGNGEGQYLGYYWLDGDFKFKPNADNWDNDLEYVTGNTISGSLTEGGGPDCPNPGAGFYQIDLDLANMYYNLVKLESVGIVGGFNGWDGDVEMTYNKDAGCWEVTTDKVSGEYKFRANHEWAINWGGTETDLVQNGENLSIEAGTYKFQLYISYAGNHKVVITKQSGGTGADGSTIISIADFNAAAESTDVWYQLTGTVKNLKDGDQYGNFDLEDSTGSVYVYGLLSEKGGAKKQFQTLVAEKGIANGKKITIVGNRSSYAGKIEVLNAYFVSIE